MYHTYFHARKIGAISYLLVLALAIRNGYVLSFFSAIRKLK
jgi:hypothetical protein